MSVNIGTIEGLLRWKVDGSELDKSLDEVAKRANISRTQLNQYNREIDSINSTYRRVAALIDPAIAAEQKFERAQSALSKALKLGLIDQQKHNDLLEKAHGKYSNLSNPLDTLKLKVGDLTSAISTFGGSAGRSLSQAADGIASLAANGVAAVAALGPLIAVAAGLALAAGGIGLAFKAFDALKVVISDGLEAQQVVEQLNQTLRTNGSASGLSAAQMIEYAGSLELVTGRSDEAIAKGESILSRFDNIGKDVFPRATRAALDLAQATGKDLDSSFTSLGKVLEGSTRGLRSLQEAGIVLTRGQTAMAEEMIKTGKIAEYQELILSALEEKVGGAAEAFGRTLPGQMSIAREEFGNFKEEIASEVIPALEDLVNSTIDNANGWTTLHNIIVGQAHEIGDIIRTMVYGIAIQYHEWAAQQDALGARISAGFAAIDSAISQFALAMSVLPAIAGGGQQWVGVANTMAEASARMAKESDQSSASAVKHALTIVDLTQKMAQHRLALEGDTKVIKNHGSALDELAEKTRKAGSAQDKLNDTAARAVQSALEAQHVQESLLAARYIGIDAMKAQQTILEALNKAQAAGVGATNEQRLAIIKATIATAQYKEQIAQVTILQKILDEQFASNIAGLKGYLQVWTDLDNITTSFLADAINDNLDQIEVGASEMTDTVKAHIDEIKDASETLREPWIRLGETIESGIFDTLNKQILEGEDRSEELWKTFKRAGLEAVQDWLRAWLQAQVVAQAAGKATSQSANGSGVAGGLSGGAGGYSGAATNLGVAVIVAIWTKVLTGLYEGFTHKNVRSGEATFGSGGITEHGDSGLAGQASKAIAELIKQIEGLSKEWHLGLVKLTSGSVTVAINSAGEYVVKTLIDSFGKVFHSLEEATDYARVQALKFADLSNVTDKIIADTIHATTATTTEQLKNEIDFATRIATQNMPEIGKQIREYTQTFVDDIRHAFELFAQNSFRNSGNFSALVEATSSSILYFTTSLMGLYNQLTGHKQDERQLAEANRVAFNAQRAIMIAQITLLIAETRARIAAYQVALLTAGKGPGQTEGGGAAGQSGGNSDGSQGSKQPPTKGGGRLSQPTFDPRNPSNDAGLQALLTVLDNLARALQGLPPEIGEGGVKVPHGGRGGGSGRDSVQSFIDDRRFQLSLASMDHYHQQLAQIDRDYKEQLKNAGKDGKLRAELLALQKQETEALKKQNQKDVIEQWKSLIGPSDAFSDLTKQFDDVKKNIQDAGFGAERAGKMIDRLTSAEEDAIKKLSSQKFSGLLGDLSSIIADSDTNAQQHLLHNELLRTQEIVNYQIKMILMQDEYVLLKAKGKLTADEIAILDKAFGWINANANILPGGKDWMFGEEVNNNINQASESLSQAADNQLDASNELRSAVESLMDYQTSLHTDASLGLVDPRTALNNSKTDFETNRALALTGNVEAIKNFRDIAERYRQNLVAFSPSSELTSNVLQGIDATINQIKSLPSVQHALTLTPDATAIVHGLNYVASGVASLAPLTHAVNDNTAETARTLRDVTPKAIADASLSTHVELTDRTLESQKLTTDKLQELKEDFQLMAGNVLAWRSEARTRDTDEKILQTAQLDELKIIAKKGKKPVAGVGG